MMSCPPGFLASDRMMMNQVDVVEKTGGRFKDHIGCQQAH